MKASDAGKSTDALKATTIVETASRLGITLRRRVWYRAADRAGCAASLAAIGACPRLAMRDFGIGEIQAALREHPRLLVIGLIDGFEGSSRSQFFGRTTSYRDGYRVGLAVARAAGLEVGRVT